jgi:outer membrane protein assembly factor BamA
MFKYVSYDVVAADTGAYYRYMDVLLKLEPLPGKSIGYEFNANTTSEKFLGTSLNLSFTQKNLLRRLDQLRFNIYAGIESQITGEDIFINTTELSSSIDLVVPRRFWPFPIPYSKKTTPKTITSIKANYISRLDFYELFNTNFRYGSQFYENTPAKLWTWNWLDINVVRILNTSPEFDEILKNNLLLLQSFQEQMIFGTNVSWVYNSQLRLDKRNDIYFKPNLELAGTMYHVLNNLNNLPQLFNGSQVPEQYIAGLPYANFLRLTLDFRNYFDINAANKIACRAEVSGAFPFWNSEVVPYVKQFFAGGSNDIRAFAVRKLGPGGYFPYYENYEDSTVTAKPGDQNGDLKLELNLEYRFDIFSIFEGALFCDIGNIWTLKPDPARPFSNFELNDFYKELAIGPGAGLRLDFSYFLIRIDAAYPLIDPALDSKNGQVRIKQIIEAGLLPPQKSVTWNIAVAYPF